MKTPPSPSPRRWRNWSSCAAATPRHPSSPAPPTCGLTGIPKRASHAETALEGQAPATDAFQAARLALAEDFQPVSDVRGSAHYRWLSAANLFERLRLIIEQTEIDGSREVMLHAYAH